MIGELIRERICLSDRPDVPAIWGITAFFPWSPPKLRDDLLDCGTVAAINREPLRRTLHTGGVPWQTTST